MRSLAGTGERSGDAGWLVAGKQGGKRQKSENSTAFEKTCILSVDDFHKKCILITHHQDSEQTFRMEVPFMVKFGERMKAARTAKHMSQQALADIIGKSLNTSGGFMSAVSASAESGNAVPSGGYAGGFQRLSPRAHGRQAHGDVFRRFRKRSGGARGQNRESSGSELNKRRPSFPEGGKASRAGVHCTPAFLQK